VAECVNAALRLEDAVGWSMEDERQSIQEHQDYYRRRHSGETPGEAEIVKERERCGCSNLRWNVSKLRRYLMSNISVILGDQQERKSPWSHSTAETVI